MEEKKNVTTVAGIIENENGEYLCSLRDKGKYEYVSYKWEFPGGKLEAGETNEQALARELMEELNIKVQIGDFFYQVEHEYPDFFLHMAVYKCKLVSHDLQMNVHKDLKWLKPSEMLDLDWAAADLPVVQKFVELNK